MNHNSYVMGGSFKVFSTCFKCINVDFVVGTSALLMAVDKGRLDIVQELIKAKADVNMKNSRGTLYN